jgi:transcriptional regulator with XRE-family HTH domain
MKYRTLQDNLRKLLSERIKAGALTGLQLAELTGFKQAHISNFLNRKRGLSVDGMDRILNVQHLSVLDLIDSHEVNRRSSIFPPSGDEFDNVAVADPQIAASHALIMSMHIREIIKFKKSFLKRIREDGAGGRNNWERFVAIRLDAQEAMSMYPRTLPGATLLLDRHYCSLVPYRKGEPNIYAVRKDGACTIKYFEVAGRNLILRPHNPAFPVEVIAKEDGLTLADYIVGRVCFIGLET